MADCSSEKKH